MLQSSDFMLKPEKLETEYQLVEVNNWRDYNTHEQLGFSYVVLFPKLKYEKIRVEVKGTSPVISNEELGKHGKIPVKFENLMVSASLFNGRLSAKGSADSVKRLDIK